MWIGLETLILADPPQAILFFLIIIPYLGLQRSRFQFLVVTTYQHYLLVLILCFTHVKHMEIDFHFLREKVQNKDLIVQYVPTDEQVAEILTKGLHSPIFVKHCSNLRLGSPPAAIKGGC